MRRKGWKIIREKESINRKNERNEITRRGEERKEKSRSS